MTKSRLKAGSDTMSKQTGDTASQKRRGKKESEEENQIQITQMLEVFTNAQAKKVSSSVVIPAPVQNSLSSSDAVSEVFNKVRFDGLYADAIATQPKTKIVLDTEKVLLSTADQFTEFDRAVLEAVFAQLTAGNTIMTPAMIFRSMTNKKSGANVSSEMLEEINKSIGKCMYGKVTIPIYNKRKNTTALFDSNILNIIRATFNVAGHETQGYEVQSAPLLYTYCVQIGALTCSPLEMNAIPISMTKRTVAIMNYLQRIVVPHLYDMNGQSIISQAGYGAKEGEDIEGACWIPPEYITYEDIYHTVMSLDNSDRTRWLENKTRDTVKRILDYWVKNNYIRRWGIVKGANNSIAGINIYYHPIDSVYALPSSPSATDSG